MAGPKGIFVAVGCNAHHSPQLARLRAEAGSLADAYFYRAYQFAKEYQHNGCMREQWSALAGWILWPDGADALMVAFRSAGVVLGPSDKLWDWDKWNGYLIAKACKDAERHRAKYRAGKASGKARKQKAQQEVRNRVVAVGR